MPVVSVLSFLPSWFDWLVIAALAAGIWAGHKRGLSVELLDLAQWLAIVIGGAIFCRSVGDSLSHSWRISPSATYPFSYLFAAIAIKIGFSLVSRALGHKPISKEYFGHAEVPLGMVAGAVRVGCMILVALALLNSKYVSPEEHEEWESEQRFSGGQARLPTIVDLQETVFTRSRAGWIVKQNLSAILVPPVKPVEFEIEKIEGYGKKMEKAVDEGIDAAERR